VKVLSKTIYQSTCDVLKDIREHVSEICDQQKANYETTEKIILAVNEACMNIIQHGYDNEENHEFTITIYLTENNEARELIIQLIDQAKKVDPLKIRSRNLDDIKPGGIGVHMIHKLMDNVKYLDHQGSIGNILELRKTL